MNRSPSPATKADRRDLHRSCKGPAPNGMAVRPAISLGPVRRPRQASPNPGARVPPRPRQPVAHRPHTEVDYEVLLKGASGLHHAIPDSYRRSRLLGTLWVETMRMDHAIYSKMVMDATTVDLARPPAAMLYQSMQLAKSMVKGLKKEDQKSKDPQGRMAKMAAVITSLRSDHGSMDDLASLQELVRTVDVSELLFVPLLTGLRKQQAAMISNANVCEAQLRRNAAARQAQIAGLGARPLHQGPQGRGPLLAANQRPAQTGMVPAGPHAPINPGGLNGSSQVQAVASLGRQQLPAPASFRVATPYPRVPPHSKGSTRIHDDSPRTQGSAQVQGPAQQGVGRAAQGPPQRSALPAHGARLQQPAPPSHGAPARSHVTNGSLGDGQARAQGAHQGIAHVAQGAGTLPANSNQIAPARTQGINGNRQDQQVPGSSSDQRSPVRRRSSPTIAPLTPKRRRSSSPPGTVSSALVPSAVANAMAQLSTQPQPLTVPTSSTTAHRPRMTVQGSSRPAQTSNAGSQAAARMPDRSLPSQNQLSSPATSATLSAPPPVPKKKVVSTDDRTAPTSPSFNRGPANRPYVGVRHGGDRPAHVASNSGRSAAPAQNVMTSRDALPTTVPPPRQRRNVGPADDTDEAADQPSTPASSGRMSAPAQDSSLSTVGMSSPQPSPLPSTVPPLNRRPIVGMASRGDPMSPSFDHGPANRPDVGEHRGRARTAVPPTTSATTRTTAQTPTRNDGNAFFAHAAPVAQQAGSNATTGGDQQPDADGRSSPDPSPRPTSAPQLPRRQMLSQVPGLHSPPASTAPTSPPRLPRRRNVVPTDDTDEAADQPSTPASSGRMSAPAQDSSLSTVGMSSPQPSPLPSTVPPLNRRPIVGMASRADPMSPSFDHGPADRPDVGENRGRARTAVPPTTSATTRTTAQIPARNGGNAFFAHAAPVAQQAGSNATTGGDQQPDADGRSSPDPSPRPTSAPQLPRRQMLSQVPGLHSPPASTAPTSPPRLPRRN